MISYEMVTNVNVFRMRFAKVAANTTKKLARFFSKVAANAT